MRNEVNQDQEITLEVIHQLVEDSENNNWNNVGNDKRERIANQAVCVLAVFLADLHGEEVFKLKLGETSNIP